MALLNVVHSLIIRITTLLSLIFEDYFCLPHSIFHDFNGFQVTSFILLHCSHRLSSVFPTLQTLCDQFLPILSFLDHCNKMAKNKRADEEWMWKESSQGQFCVQLQLVSFVANLNISTFTVSTFCKYFQHHFTSRTSTLFANSLYCLLSQPPGPILLTGALHNEFPAMCWRTTRTEAISTRLYKEVSTRSLQAQSWPPLMGSISSILAGLGKNYCPCDS